MTMSRIATSLAFAGLLVASGSAMADDQTAASPAMQVVGLSAVVVPGAKPIPKASFTITSLQVGATQSVVANGNSGLAKVQLPTGRYKVVAAFGHAKREHEITVGPKPANHVLDLNAGTVTMQLIREIGGPGIETGVTWEILTYGRDSQGKRHHVASSEKSQAKFVLPEGYYLAQAVKDGREVRHTIEVTSGHNYNYSVIYD